MNKVRNKDIWDTRLIQSASDLGLFQNLKKPKTLEDISSEFGWNLNASSRFLNTLTFLGVTEVQSEKYGTSPNIEQTKEEIRGREDFHLLDQLYEKYNAKKNKDLLQWFKGSDDALLANFDRDANPVGWLNIHLLRYYVLIVNQFFRTDVIEQALKTGHSQVHTALSLNTNQIFDHYEKYGHILSLYSDGFSAINLESNREFVNKISINSGGHVLDIGGGNGSLASLFAKLHPELASITVYDLPSTENSLAVSRRRETFSVGDKISWAYGSFFDDKSYGKLSGISVGQSFDIITMGWIIHDWNDEQSIDILKKTSKHLSKMGKIFLLEFISGERPNDQAFATIDFLMLLMADGFERTLDQYKILADKANLKYENHFLSKLGRDVIVLGPKK